MCGQFELMAKYSEIVEELGDFELENPEFLEQFNIYKNGEGSAFHFVPTSKLLSIKSSNLNVPISDGNLSNGNPSKEDNKKYLEEMRWGLLPNWSNDIKTSYKMFNARIETIFEKKSFSSLIRKNRCVIIGSSYFEWKAIENSKKKIKYRFSPNDKNLFLFAGLYNNWLDKSTGEIIPSVTMITKPAIDEISHIHNRMPAILSHSQFDIWLHSDIKTINDVDFLYNQEIAINFEEVV